MHKPESVPENEIYKIFRDFEIETDHSISARQPDLEIVKKKKKNKKKKKKNKGNEIKKKTNRGIYRPGWPHIKNIRKRNDK